MLSYRLCHYRTLENVDGHIIHINSVAGHKVIRSDSTNVYSASKFAVTALTEILRNELSLIESKIKVSSISPGFVETDFIDAAMKKSKYAEDEDKAREIQAFLKIVPMLYPKDIADAIIYVLSTPPHVQIHELTIKPVGEQF